MSARIGQTGSFRGTKRRDRLVEDTRHDPYRLDQKLPDSTGCPNCGAVYREGRWQWRSDSAPAAERICPACRRIEDHYPAGIVTLGGTFLAAHRQEILNLLTNVEAHERSEHPQQRVMEIESGEADELIVTTTGSHLARAMGEALHRAYEGALNFRYAERENLIRVSWQREL